MRTRLELAPRPRRRAQHLRAALAAGALAAACAAGPDAPSRPATTGSSSPPADLIVLDALVTTQDPDRPEAGALAVRGESFVAVGDPAEVLALRGPDTVVIEAGGRRLVPGLIDSHLHAVRGGRFYNLELRWEGVDSLERALELVRLQAARTPAGQWVRVVGGWSPYQFRERRMPTPAELEAAAPGVPVLVLFLYSQALLNRAGVEALGITADTVPPPGGRYELVEGGAVLHAEPDPTILYTTIARLPELSPADRLNSTRHFFRELNRLGLTGAVDAGGGGHAYPEDYAAVRALAADDGLTLRLSNFLFAQRKGAELEAFERWTAEERRDPELALDRVHGLVIGGAGENLVWSAGDFENFLAPRPELAPGMEAELRAVVRLLAREGWPIRIHATYDESIRRVLDVFEPVFRETGYRARWCIDHAETISDESIARIRALGGGVAVQDRMAFAGELFAERYGSSAASSAPPLRRLLDAGLPVGAGTDATRVSSYNPWVALAWMVTGRTVGGTQLAAPENRLTRAEALRLYTLGSAWLAGDEALRGRIAPGQLADFALLDGDWFALPEERLAGIESLLTVTGGEVVHAAGPFAGLAPALPPVSPAWSPAAGLGRPAAVLPVDTSSPLARNP